MKKEVYELQQISVWGQRYPKRRMHLQRIGIFDTLKDAKDCMRLYIKDEKDRYQSWGRDYSKECLGYLINSQQILQKELPDFNYHPLWWSYNANGEANDHSLANVHGDFYGRPLKDIRFQVGDIVEVVCYDETELAIVGMLPPTPERYEELKQRCLDEFYDRPFKMDESDDCYLVYNALGEGDTHQHVECYKVFPPGKKVPESIAHKLKQKMEEMKKSWPVF